MLRRAFLATAAAAALMPFAAIGDQRNYVRGLDKTLMDEGKVIVVHFSTDWCPTCQSQKRTIAALRSANPAYDAALTFVNYDFDIFGSEGLAAELKIPRRSVIVWMKDGKEMGRVFLSTSKTEIEALLDAALAAATTNS